MERLETVHRYRAEVGVEKVSMTFTSWGLFTLQRRNYQECRQFVGRAGYEMSLMCHVNTPQEQDANADVFKSICNLSAAGPRFGDKVFMSLLSLSLYWGIGSKTDAQSIQSILSSCLICWMCLCNIWLWFSCFFHLQKGVIDEGEWNLDVCKV